MSVSAASSYAAAQQQLLAQRTAAHAAGAAAPKTHSFGSQVPFAEPYWYNTYHSPYYTESHREFRAKVRKFVDEEIRPFIHDWDEAGSYPPELHEKAYAAGIYAAMWPAEYGGTPPKSVDAFHDLILIDELGRIGASGPIWSCFCTFGIALPPVLSVGSQHVKDLCARDVITGKKVMALAVTEPQAGSDVANLTTTAEKTPDGKFYILNGVKKFISGGMKASWFTVAARTGGNGMGGVSLLLVDANSEGVRRTRMKTQGWWSSSTTLIAFDGVKVPVENLIGKENSGFASIMSNFNHERFVFAAIANRHARVMLEEAIQFGRTRKTFGKRLMDHQVLRHKVAEMARHVEATHALLEQIAYQMTCGVNDKTLSGMIALTKVQATKTMDLCAREATQIIGGAACIRGGPGATVERLYREVRQNAIAGGSEEVLIDLAMRQAKL